MLSTDPGERQGRVVLGQGCGVETCVLVGMRCNKIVCPGVLISGDASPSPSETFTWGQVCPDGARGGSLPESGSGSPGGNLKWDSPHWPHLVSCCPEQKSDICHRGGHRLVPTPSGKKEPLPCTMTKPKPAARDSRCSWWEPSPRGSTRACDGDSLSLLCAAPPPATSIKIPSGAPAPAGSFQS